MLLVSPAWPCSPGGAPCPCGWGGSDGRSWAAGGTPTPSHGGGSGAGQPASSSTAPRGTCRPPSCHKKAGQWSAISAPAIPRLTKASLQPQACLLLQNYLYQAMTKLTAHTRGRRGRTSRGPANHFYPIRASAWRIWRTRYPRRRPCTPYLPKRDCLRQLTPSRCSFRREKYSRETASIRPWWGLETVLLSGCSASCCSPSQDSA